MPEAIRALEELTCAAAARQARATAAFDASRRAAQAARGCPAARRAAAWPAQIAHARRGRPTVASSTSGLARILTTEMPHTMAAFRAGRITEWRATLLVRETACLSLTDRHHVDAVLARDPGSRRRWATGELVAAVRQLPPPLDPAVGGPARRRAEAERTVTLRPAPDAMTYLTALLPVAQGVAALAALTREADSRRAAGEAAARAR